MTEDGRRRHSSGQSTKSKAEIGPGGIRGRFHGPRKADKLPSEVREKLHGPRPGEVGKRLHGPRPGEVEKRLHGPRKAEITDSKADSTKAQAEPRRTRTPVLEPAASACPIFIPAFLHHGHQPADQPFHVGLFQPLAVSENHPGMRQVVMQPGVDVARD